MCPRSQVSKPSVDCTIFLVGFILTFGRGGLRLRQIRRDKFRLALTAIVPNIGKLTTLYYQVVRQINRAGRDEFPLIRWWGEAPNY